jgi:hypothetical protein
VRRTQTLWNEHVKPLAEDFIGTVAKDSLSPRVPNLDQSPAVGKDHRVR